MNPGRFAPRALRELRRAVEWIAEDNEDAAAVLLETAVRAAGLIAGRPGMAHVRLDLAPARFRFWPLRGFSYLMVFDTDRTPPVVARFVHQSRDLPTVLGDLGS